MPDSYQTAYKKTFSLRLCLVHIFNLDRTLLKELWTYLGAS